MPNMPHDPIVTEPTRHADHLEPRFEYPEQEAAATERLAQFSKDGKRPNVLMIVFDDVGWGDFGCYGGGVAVGAATPNIDRLARQGLLLTSCYSEPSCTPSRASLMTGRLPMRHGLLRPPMYGEPGGLQGEVTIAPAARRRRVRHPGGGEVAHGRERGVPAPERRLRRLLRVPQRLGHVHRVARPVLLPRGRVQRRAHQAGSRTSRSTGASCTGRRASELENVEEVTIPVLSAARRQVGRLLARLPSAHGCAGAALVPLPLHPRRALRQLPARAVPRARRRRSTRTRTRSSSSTTSSGGSSRELEATGQLEDTIVFVTSDNGPEMETWPDAAYSPFRSSKGSTWEGGQRVPGIVSWPGMIDADRASDGLFSLMDWFPTMLRLAGAEASDPRRPLHRRRRPDVVPARRATVTRTASTSTTGSARRSRRCASRSGSSCSRRRPTTTTT